MNVLAPITITSAMIGAGTSVAEPAAGEIAWTDAAYSVGDKRIRTQTHRVYECVAAIASATGKPPEDDAIHWLSMPRANADAALAHLQSILDVPVSWISTTCPGYEGLNVFGLGS